MAIKIFSDKIQIGDYNLFEGNGGVQFDGVARAENFLGNQTYQGSINGYTTGGGTPTTTNDIQRFSFATNTNATNVADLTVARMQSSGCGQKSSSHGYVAGGANPTPAAVNTIDKFLFTTDSNATDVGDLTQATSINITGHSSSMTGYVCFNPPSPTAFITNKFPFATDTNASAGGSLFATVGNLPGQHSSSTHGYLAGGGDAVNSIQKFPFANEVTGTDVGDLTQARRGCASQSSTTNGYTSMGWNGGTLNTIDKFPFATDTNASDVGDTTRVNFSGHGQSSTSHGYTSGGQYLPLPGDRSIIDKFPFSTDTNASSVGSLATGVVNCTGNQF